MNSLCAFVAHGEADAYAKAGYLNRFVADGDLQPDQLVILLWSAVRS